ncbi:PAT1 multi-domain protein [Pyrenophora tritici-repentis]|nr:PAT1 multi-domain protein [Pyrenophora tritici-repentis]
MSQYNHMPPPGPYVPPNQSAPAQQHASQAPTSHQYNTGSYGCSNQAQKGVGGFGQMMNQRLEQAVTTGKPMLNKLGNAISSKLGNKPTPGPPQHLQNYQNYQNQYGQHNQAQTYQQPHGQSLSPPPPPQQNWGHPPPPRPSNASPAAQHSPYQQPTHHTPTSGPPGQINYFPQQTNQAPATQAYTHQSPPTTLGYNPSQYSQGGSPGGQMQTQGQLGQGQDMQGHLSASFQTHNQVQSHHTGQQMGVVGGSQGVQNTSSPHTSSVSPVVPAQQWGHLSTEHTSGVVSQSQADVPTKPLQPYSPTPTPNPLEQKEQKQQQLWNLWNSATPVNTLPQGQLQTLPGTANSSNTHDSNSAPQIPSNKPVHSSLQPVSPLQDNGAHSGPTEFIAELPGDMGSLTLLEAKPQTCGLGITGSQYQAYRPSGSQTGSPSPGPNAAHQTSNGSNKPLADPWRFANIATETPTREFYILADLLFDALDRKFEPRHTGLLEAPKMLGGWVRLTQDARDLFSYKSYSAFAKLWSLEGIPHMMVPCEAALAPNWNFDQDMHARDMQVCQNPPTSYSRYPTYMPALNRAGWYKFFFLEMMHAPDDIEALVPALCADTYKPGVLQHPDLNKRDRTDMGGLQARAAAVKTFAMQRVCEETKAAMAEDPDVSPGHRHAGMGS